MSQLLFLLIIPGVIILAGIAYAVYMYLKAKKGFAPVKQQDQASELQLSTLQDEYAPETSYTKPQVQIYESALAPMDSEPVLLGGGPSNVVPPPSAYTPYNYLPVERFCSPWVPPASQNNSQGVPVKGAGQAWYDVVCTSG